MYDPTFVQPQTKEFLDCYARMVDHTKAKCQDEFNSVLQCVTKHVPHNGFPVKCVQQMENFNNC